MANESDDEVLGGVEDSVKPYRGEYASYSRIPEVGRDREEILREMEELRSKEESRWKDGFASGAVYSGDAAHIEFLNRVYAINSQSNPLHSDLWPSTTKFEAEVVAMTANMLGASEAEGGPVCGVVSSGGTESILLAMKTYRDWARAVKGITDPEMVVPTTAHAAFDKASQYFNIRMIRVPVDVDYKADVAATEKAISENTVVVVGSAPSFPQGTIDPVEELSGLAQERGIGFHTDGCLGGFLLPWAARLGYDVPPFDFRLLGVTSISVDTHKYGYAAKGSSVILYRNRELRSYQFYTNTDWPGGLYLSPTFAGSRPGALSATAWAAIVALGEKGYLEGTKKILETASSIKKGIAEIPELRVMGDPLFDVAFTSEAVDIYKVMDSMAEKNWNLNGLQRPPGVHICVTLRHTQPGVAERLLSDLRSAVDQVKSNPEEVKDGLGRMYGMAAELPSGELVEGFMKEYMDLLYEV
jgi:glutamate/tyrosine decarboxylase-like PLP-dependent enzyme